MSADGQGTKCRRNIAENFNRLSRAHKRYRRQTDGRAIAYSEGEREFTFAKNRMAYRGNFCGITMDTFLLGGAGVYVYDVVVKSSHSLSHLLIECLVLSCRVTT